MFVKCHKGKFYHKHTPRSTPISKWESVTLGLHKSRQTASWQERRDLTEPWKDFSYPGDTGSDEDQRRDKATRDTERCHRLLSWNYWHWDTTQNRDHTHLGGHKKKFYQNQQNSENVKAKVLVEHLKIVFSIGPTTNPDNTIDYTALNARIVTHKDTRKVDTYRNRKESSQNFKRTSSRTCTMIYLGIREDQY